MSEQKDGWTSTLLKGAAVALAGALALWLWEGARSWLESAWQATGAHLDQSVTLQRWALYPLALLSAHTVISWARRLMPDKTPSHTRFTQDSFFGALWRWMYDTSGHPHSPAAFCQGCDMRLTYSFSDPLTDFKPMRVRLHCERCASCMPQDAAGIDELQGRVLREVDRLIRTGEWEERAPEAKK